MSVAVGTLNFVLGAVYLQYGTMTMIEMKRNWSRMGFSHFGAAWIAMAFTCGPHHLAHGEHMLFHGQPGGALDLAGGGGGLPRRRDLVPAAGRGVPRRPRRPLHQRHPAGSWPPCPSMAGMYVGAIIVAHGQALDRRPTRLPTCVPSMLLVVLYLVIGYYLTRTQLANRRPLGGWSLSGLSLAIVFPTCAAMHAVFAAYTLSGLYPLDIHTLVIDCWRCPRRIYFVWVVQALYRGTFRDWNRAGRVVPANAA